MAIVTVVSCVYGTNYRRFIHRWVDAIASLDPRPDAVIVATDGDTNVPGVKVIESYCHWLHPQAWHLQKAIMAAETDWVWVIDIDDIAKPDGLAGIETVAADVWQMGFDRSDGETYLPPNLTPAEYLASTKNVYVAGSAFRTDIFRDCGGFRDIALQDWGLWRTLARHGATVQASDRTHFRYMRHPLTRGATELTMDVRAEHLAEMMEAEPAYA
jgi:hypothetical protein